MATATTTRKPRQTRQTQQPSNENTREVLVNPFNIGDSITIPSGTIFTSTNPSLKGRQQVKRAHKVTISDTIPARVAPRRSERGAKVLVRPLRIRAKGSGGYFKDITLTEKIVRMNGRIPTYETISLELPEQEQ